MGKFLGKGLAESFSAEYGAIDDPLLLQWVQRVGAQMAAVSPRHNLPYHFTILNTAEINAFTLPGGYVFVTRGLLDYLRSQDELAGVVGHEVGHVAGNHPMRAIEWQLGASLAVRFGPLPHGAIPSTLEQGGVFLATLHFSRQHESQADQYGIRFATTAGYEPEGLLQFLSSLGVEKRPGLIARYLATHPPTIDRIHALQRTPYMDPRNWQIQESVGDHLMASWRPAVAVRHYRIAVAAHPGDPDLDRKLESALALCGGGVPAHIPPPPIKNPAPGDSPAAQSYTPNPQSDTPNPQSAAPTPQSSDVSDSTAVTQTAAQAALNSVQDDLNKRVKRVGGMLRQFRQIEGFNVTLRDALLGAAASRLGDIRWLVLAYQAYGEVNRLDDLYARLAQVDRSLLSTTAAMQGEVASSPPGMAPSRDAWAAALRMAGETRASGIEMSGAATHLERGIALMTAVLADLDSVLVGFRARVNNIRFATVEAALLTARRDIDLGRRQSGRSLDQIALAQDRLLLVQMNRLGREADEPHLTLFDYNAAGLMGLDPARFRELRQKGMGYGDTAFVLALGEELGKNTPEVQDRYHRMEIFDQRQGVPRLPLSWVDAAVDQGGSPAFLEIMLRQVAQAIREEASCA